jgi:hypothetical protein
MTQLMLDSARSCPDAPDWEQDAGSYVFLRAFHMGYMGKVEARRAGAGNQSFHVAARRAGTLIYDSSGTCRGRVSVQEELDDYGAIPVPGAKPPAILVAISGLNVKKYAGQILKGLNAGQILYPGEWASERIMTARAGPQKREGYPPTRIYWKNPDVSMREAERRGFAGDPEGRRRALVSQIRSGSVPAGIDPDDAGFMADLLKHRGAFDEFARRSLDETILPTSLRRGRYFVMQLPGADLAFRYRGRFGSNAILGMVQGRRVAKKSVSFFEPPARRGAGFRSLGSLMSPESRAREEAKMSRAAAMVYEYTLRYGHLPDADVLTTLEGKLPPSMVRRLQRMGRRHPEISVTRKVLPVRGNPDEGFRRDERRAAAGDPQAEARVLRGRLRANTTLPENVRLAACLGYVPAQLAIDWVPPEPPFGSPDCVMVTLSQDNEWGHRMAALWAYALVKGTEWVWTDALSAMQTELDFGGIGVYAPNDALPLIEQFLSYGSPCPLAEEHERHLALQQHTVRLSDIVHELDTIAFDNQDNEYAPGADHYLLAEAAGQWVKALVDALVIWGNYTHSHSRESVWGNRHTLGQLWQVGPDDSVPSVSVPRYARLARETYRAAVWAVDYYRGGSNRPGPVLDKAQLDVERWARAIMIPELLA